MTGLDWARAKKKTKVWKKLRHGTSMPGAKLDDEKVQYLRSGDCNLHALARAWNVDRKTLRDARDGKSWTHVSIAS